MRRYARYDLLSIDEFGFAKIERSETPQAANLLDKIIDARTQRSTALVTNIDFDAWGEYLGDPPLALAFLDRVVDGAIILKIKGRSFARAFWGFCSWGLNRPSRRPLDWAFSPATVRPRLNASSRSKPSR